MRRVAVICLVVCLIAASAFAGSSDQPRYRIGVTTGLGNLRTPDKPHFTFNSLWGVSAGTTGRLAFTVSLTSQKNYSSSTASGNFGFFAVRDDSTLIFKSLRLGIDGDYRLIDYGALRPTVGAGIGYMFWKTLAADGDTVIQTLGDRSDPVDFKATELYLSSSVGLDYRPRPDISVHLKAGLDYLTGIGTSFSETTDKNRGQVLMRAAVTLSWLFGVKRPQPSLTDMDWPVKEKPKEPVKAKNRPAPTPYQPPALPIEHDADGDGVLDKYDRSPNTPTGAVVDAEGRPIDSDGDGVPDGLDDCPDTPPQAAGYTDIFGCPIDSDFDGIPDFRDSCATGPVGAIVDAKGCPLDGDGDGVPDGLDDCPNTEPGIEVDSRGCIDVSFLRDTVRIYVNYLPGSFEVDERTKTRMQPLIRKLLILTNVSFEIVAYTDNVGTPDANELLSQKRANRMRDWLQSEGISSERMTPVGRGEVNFIDTNDTAEGRTKNRRLELIFKTQ